MERWINADFEFHGGDSSKGGNGQRRQRCVLEFPCHCPSLEMIVDDRLVGALCFMASVLGQWFRFRQEPEEGFDQFVDEGAGVPSGAGLARCRGFRLESFGASDGDANLR